MAALRAEPARAEDEMKNGRQDGRWVTMRDVAREAGVGAITVSRVIRTPEKVKPETRARVEAAIRALGYVPDETAGALSSAKSRIVGAVVSTLDNAVFASTIGGLTEELGRAGYQLVLASTNYDPEAEARLVATLLGRRPDGLVLTSTEHRPETRRLLEGCGIPTVELWELPPSPIDRVVGFSNRAAGRAITRYLIGKGHRRIGFIGGRDPNDHRGRQRAEGYREALAEAGLGESRAVTVEARGPEAGAIGLGRLLDEWPDTSAVICVSDPVALGAFCEAGRRGLKVPEGLAVTGFGDQDFAGERGIGLTTVRVPGPLIGRQAARLLLTGPEPLGTAERIVDVGFEIVRRLTA